MGSNAIHLSYVIVTRSVDSSAENETILAGYVPDFDQTITPKTPIMIIDSRLINANLIILFMFILAPD
jgi:hypothetical protein